MHHEFFHLAKRIVEEYPANKFALATVVHVRGSAYRREGTRMLIGASGNWTGNISGGCLEGDILLKARKVIESGESFLITYDTRESENKEIRVALGCNGVIDILIEPVNESLLKMSQKVMQIFLDEETASLTTKILHNGENISVSHQLNEQSTNEAAEQQDENFCSVERTDQSITLHEHIGLQRKLVLWGSGPDIDPLAEFAQRLGWKTVVLADQTNNLSERLKNTEIVQAYPESFMDNITLHENTAVVLVSHDYFKDYFVLEKIAGTKLKYIGIMGPKRRGDRMLKELNENHPDLLKDESIVHYPVGLDIGSDNPAEIALSIIAEIQSIFSGKSATPLKEKETRIHDAHPDDMAEEYNPTDNVCSINQFQ